MKKAPRRTQVLLIEDVEHLGRSGDVASARSGYVRNFLVPQKKVVVANAHTLKMRARLQKEREAKAAKDRSEAESLAQQLKDVILSTEVKVDPEGKMYGSVSALDVVKMLGEKGFVVERRHVLINPIKATGSHTVSLKLNEGVAASITLEIIPEGGFPQTEKQEESQG